MSRSPRGALALRRPLPSAGRRPVRTSHTGYTKRLEHIHTLSARWDLEDDFQRALAWQSLGVDDVLEVSVPWSLQPGVGLKDSVLPKGPDRPVPVMVREYETPAGPLRHAVRKTTEELGTGWVVQPDHVPLFEDFNIHALKSI